MINTLLQRWYVLFVPAVLAATLYFLIFLANTGGKPVVTAVISGQPVVALSPEQQQEEEVATMALAPVSGQPRTPILGTVADLGPVIQLHDQIQRLQSVGSAQPAGKPPATPATPSPAPLTGVGTGTVTGSAPAPAAASASAPAPVSAPAIPASGQTVLPAATAQNFRSAVRLQFGARLAHWLLTPSSQTRKLWAGQAALLQVTLPDDGDPKPPASLDIPVGQDSQQDSQMSATLIGTAAPAGSVRPGNDWWYFVPAALPANGRIITYLPASDPAAATLFIPAKAVVWENDQPWAYVAADTSHFVRRPVSQRSPWNGGYFVSSGFRAGDRIVIQGADRLLAAERQAMGGRPGS